MTVPLLLKLSFVFAFSIIIFQNVSLSQDERKPLSVPAPKALRAVLTPAPVGTYDENGCPTIRNQSWVPGRAIGCEVSPNGMLLGKFVFNGLSTPERYYELFIREIPGNKQERRIYAGDFRTLGWEWVGSEQVEITYNCGTGCQALKKIQLDESISSSDYLNGQMNEKNGWAVIFHNTF